jgi:purine-binding chemotaxis protein CheW
MSPRFCTFRVGGLLLGIEVEHIQEVLRVEQVTPVPLAPPEVRGLVNLRGRVVTAIDLRYEFGIAAAAGPGGEGMHIILADGNGTVSFVVDSVGEVVVVPEDTFESPPETLKGASRRLIRGAYKLAHQLMLVIDADYAADLSAHH